MKPICHMFSREAGSMNPDKHITPKEIRNLCQGGYV